MNRVILKISGEALASENALIDNNKLNSIYDTIQILKSQNCLVAIIIGGGNIFRGREHPEISNNNSTAIGVSASIINSLYIKDYLEHKGLNVALSTPFELNSLVEVYSDEELKSKYEHGDIIVFGGGYGKVGYSTDSGIIIANQKIKCDLIIKMSNVDGVYDSDPKTNKSAKKYNTVSYKKVIQNDLKVMDLAAVKECEEHNIKILVMDFKDYMKTGDIFKGKQIGTLIGDFDE